MRLKRVGVEYRIVDLEPDELDKLLGLPGLQLHLDARTATGKADAVSAACGRLGQPYLPVLRQLGGALMWPWLRAYQVSGVNALLSVLREAGGALLADEMGLGKTRQAIAVARQLGGRTLVVCPAAVRETWAQELGHLGMGHAVRRPSGARKAERESWERDRLTARFIVTSYDLIADTFTEAWPHGMPTTVIMDEAHNLCGRGTKRTRAVQEIAALATYRLAITATPMWSRPRDYYSLLRILVGSRFGGRGDFALAYCAGTPNEYGGIDDAGVSRAEELAHRLSFYMVRRTKAEVAKELPPLTRQVHWLDPTDEAAHAYAQLQIRESGHGLQGALSATLDGKINYAATLAAEAKRFLLFTWRKADAKRLAAAIRKLGGTCEVVTGDQDTVARGRAVEAARAAGGGVVATLDSLGVGVNLQGLASTGIFHSLDWVSLKLVQAEARLHRLGQTENVHWHYVAMRDSADELVVRTVVEKLDAFQATTGRLDNGGTNVDASVPADGGLRAVLVDDAGRAEAEQAVLAELYASL